ncbi:hypothetical protein [Pseudonocardia oroxyli]|uniref:Uncharacterized protein n=1 Tax=Pseudonocardia oroxyli TaxID=366584 RepID=A0A1G7UCF6_PSEOR|nr:hypothetical protein [Pseudonocardia oroxyli]SDG45134.1 hypothetical protein SAMN05216377_1122 [Pseudonocardia oroxyli]
MDLWGGKGAARTAVLLSAHVLTAIVVIGPVTVATSMLPRVARGALDGSGSVAVVRVLHRISRVSAALGTAVPVFGFATGAAMGVQGDPWLVVSTALTLEAALLLGLRVLPGQAAVLSALEGERPETARAIRTPPTSAGVFALPWAVVVVLLIVRPGSTTGA